MEVPTLRVAIARAYRRAFTPPFGVPSALIGNALLMTAAWFLLPQRAHDWLFTLHGPLAFPVVMASWMLGDTPSTNVAGFDVERALAVLDDRAAFRTWLTARTFVLSSLVGVPCAIVALIMAFDGQPVVKALAACAVIAVLPFGILPIASWLGLLMPYHPRTFGWRWQHRTQWLRIVRWIVLLLAPFVVVPTVAGIIVGPSIALARGLGAPAVPLSTPAFVGVAACICGTALVTAWLGLRGADLIRRLRRDRLAAYLRDPEAP